MSIVNNMLKNLHSKQQKIPSAHDDNGSNHSVAPPPGPNKSKRLIYLIIILIVVVAIALIITRKKPATSNHNSNGDEATMTINRTSTTHEQPTTPPMSDVSKQPPQESPQQPKQAPDNPSPNDVTPQHPPILASQQTTKETTANPTATQHATPMATAHSNNVNNIQSKQTMNHPNSVTHNTTQIADAQPPRIKIEEPPLTQAQQLTKQYNEAMTQLHQGKNQQAIEDLLAILDQQPQYKDARLSLAALYINQGRIPPAERLLKIGLQQSPNDPDYAKLYAHILVQRGAVIQALHLLNQAKPDNLDGHVDYFALMASLYMQQQDYKNAETLYRRLVSQQPLNSIWWAGLGIAADKLGLTMEARDAFTRANKIGDLPPALQHYINDTLRQ